MAGNDKIRLFPNLPPEYSSRSTLISMGLFSTRNSSSVAIVSAGYANSAKYVVETFAVKLTPQEYVYASFDKDGIAYYCENTFGEGNSRTAPTFMIQQGGEDFSKNPVFDHVSELNLKPLHAIAKKRDAEKTKAFPGFSDYYSNLQVLQGIGITGNQSISVAEVKKGSEVISKAADIYPLSYDKDDAKHTIYLRQANDPQTDGSLYYCDEHGNYLSPKEVKDLKCITHFFQYIQSKKDAKQLNIDNPVITTGHTLEQRIKASQQRFGYLPKDGRISKELKAIEEEHKAIVAGSVENGLSESYSIDDLKRHRSAALAARLSALEFDSVKRKIYWKTQAGSIFAASSVAFMVGGAFLLQGDEAEPNNTEDIDLPEDDDSVGNEDSDPIMDFFAGDLHLEGLPAALFFAACAFYSNWLVCRPFLMSILLDKAKKDYLPQSKENEFSYKEVARESAAILAAIAWAVFAEVAAVELVTALMYGEDKDVGAFGFKAATEGEFFNLENLPGVLGVIMGFAATFVLIYYTTLEPMKKIAKNYQTYWDNFIERVKENPLWLPAYIVLIGIPLLTGGVMTTIASVEPFEEILGDELAAWGVCIAGILGISALYFYSAIGVLDSIAKTFKTRGKNIAEYGEEAGLAWGVHFGDGVFTFNRGNTAVFTINVLSTIVTAVILLGITAALVGNGIGHGFPAVEGTENFGDNIPEEVNAFIFAGAAFTSIITNIKGVERAETIADPTKLEMKNGSVGTPKNLWAASNVEIVSFSKFSDTNALKPTTDFRPLQIK